MIRSDWQRGQTVAYVDNYGRVLKGRIISTLPKPQAHPRDGRQEARFVVSHPTYRDRAMTVFARQIKHEVSNDPER